MNKNLENIILGELIMVMHNTVKINRCLEEDGYCSMGVTKTCKVHKYYVKMQTLLEDIIFNISLKDILDEKYNIPKDGEVFDSGTTV